MSKKIKLGIIGCGAVSELYYLPVLKDNEDFCLTALAEKNPRQGEMIASLTGVDCLRQDYREILDRVDAVVIALPNALHASVAVDCLNRGVHVFIEKPMAVSTRECDAMINAAHAGGLVMAVGHSKRFFNTNRFVKQCFEDGIFGDVISVDARDGCVFQWPVVSVRYFRPESACGLLLDMGAHVLDLLLWWLGEHAVVRYRDDACGGIEADCELDIDFRSGCRGFVAMSRTHDLRRTYLIETERATVEIDAGWLHPWVKIKNRSRASLEGRPVAGGFPQNSYLDVMKEQLADFSGAVRDEREPFVSGQEARRCIALIEDCYRNRQPLLQPWVSVGERDHE